MLDFMIWHPVSSIWDLTSNRFSRSLPAPKSTFLMQELLDKLGLKRCPQSLRLALTHPSAVGKGLARVQESNQRLEFLGDALLGSVVAEHLFRENPLLNEGALTLRKISVVRKESLAAAARRLQLGQHLILGPHEDAAGGRERDSILADALEATFGAIYLSTGHKTTATIILKVLSEEIQIALSQPASLTSSKNLLQEKTQAMGLGTPRYQTQEVSSDSAQRLFHSQVFASDQNLGEGSGSSKKAAEAAAAEAAMEQLSSLPLQTSN